MQLCDVISLSKEPTVFHGGYRPPKFLFSDYVQVNISKVKTNDLAIVTCSLKSYFGLMPTRHAVVCNIIGVNPEHTSHIKIASENTVLIFRHSILLSC